MDEHSVLLRLLRAVVVLDGVDAAPAAEGVIVGRRLSSPVISWTEVAALLGDDDPLAPAPRLRLALLLVLHQKVASLRTAAAETLATALRPLALPVGHVLHPGPTWVRETVPGGVLELGPGVTGLVRGQDVLPLPASVAAAAGIREPRPCPGLRPDPVYPDWTDLRARAERPANLALARLLDPGDRPAVLVAEDGVDALTMLALPTVRNRLAGPAAAPSRDRAWLGSRATDEAYLRAVWMLTPVVRRGSEQALTVGPDGVAPLRPAQRSGSSPIGS